VSNRSIGQVAVGIVVGLAVTVTFAASRSKPNPQNVVPLSVLTADTATPPSVPVLTVPPVAEVDQPTPSSTVLAVDAVTTPLTSVLPVSVPTTSPPPATATVDVLEMLATIVIENEHDGGYNRNLFAVWNDIDNNGCDTRDDVLRSEATTITEMAGCATTGQWVSVYDDVIVGDAVELEVDHVVALKEAWDSGAWAWDVNTRIGFANDLTDPRTLAAVTAVSNQAKGDRDPSNWIPTANLCTYLSDWVSIKHRWGLTMDQSEHGRIRNLYTDRCI
jgi:hypothetical protein